MMREVIRYGFTPRTTSSSRMRPTPATTLSTVPTGGVMRPMAPLSTNIRPKYTGSMPALTAMGSITGAMIRMVGVRSSAVPTTTRANIMKAISSRGWSTSGPSHSVRVAGRSASVTM